MPPPRLPGPAAPVDGNPAPTQPAPTQPPPPQAGLLPSAPGGFGNTQPDFETAYGKPVGRSPDGLDVYQTGLADLPWHRDCGMGGHSVKCPLLNVGIQLDAATPAAGQLQMIAGSHRGTSRLPADDDVDGLPVVAITTGPGDVTAHFGHTLHAAPPPADKPVRAGQRGRWARAPRMRRR